MSYEFNLTKKYINFISNFILIKDFRQAVQTYFINYDGKLFNSRTISPSEKSLKVYLVEKSGIVQLVQRRPVSRLDAHDVPVIV